MTKQEWMLFCPDAPVFASLAVNVLVRTWDCMRLQERLDEIAFELGAGD